MLKRAQKDVHLVVENVTIGAWGSATGCTNDFFFNSKKGMKPEW